MRSNVLEITLSNSNWSNCISSLEGLFPKYLGLAMINNSVMDKESLVMKNIYPSIPFHNIKLQVILNKALLSLLCILMTGKQLKILISNLYINTHECM